MPDSGVTEADRRWLTSAIELSRLAAPTRTNYAVGAIVVGHTGGTLATGFTGEIDPRDHAEEAALAKLAGADLSRSTVYSSLEPCTARRSRPGTCTELILAAGVGRVVFALREPPHFVVCHGAATLRAAGVQVEEIAELAGLVRAVNAHLLGPGNGPDDPAVRPGSPARRSGSGLAW